MDSADSPVAPVDAFYAQTRADRRLARGLQQRLDAITQRLDADFETREAGKRRDAAHGQLHGGRFVYESIAGPSPTPSAGEATTPSGQRRGVRHGASSAVKERPGGPDAPTDVYQFMSFMRKEIERRSAAVEAQSQEVGALEVFRVLTHAEIVRLRTEFESHSPETGNPMSPDVFVGAIMGAMQRSGYTFADDDAVQRLDKELRRLFEAMDFDDSGDVDWDEFANYMLFAQRELMRRNPEDDLIPTVTRSVDLRRSVPRRVQIVNVGPTHVAVLETLPDSSMLLLVDTVAFAVIERQELPKTVSAVEYVAAIDVYAVADYSGLFSVCRWQREVSTTWATLRKRAAVMPNAVVLTYGSTQDCLVGGCADGTLAVLTTDALRGDTVLTPSVSIRPFTESVSCISPLPMSTTKVAAAALFSGTIVFDCRTGVTLLQFQPHDPVMRAVASSGGGGGGGNSPTKDGARGTSLGAFVGGVGVMKYLKSNNALLTTGNGPDSHLWMTVGGSAQQLQPDRGVGDSSTEGSASAADPSLPLKPTGTLPQAVSPSRLASVPPSAAGNSIGTLSDSAAPHRQRVMAVWTDADLLPSMCMTVDAGGLLKTWDLRTLVCVKSRRLLPDNDDGTPRFTVLAATVTTAATPHVVLYCSRIRDHVMCLKRAELVSRQQLQLQSDKRAQLERKQVAAIVVDTLDSVLGAVGRDLISYELRTGIIAFRFEDVVDHGSISCLAVDPTGRRVYVGTTTGRLLVVSTAMTSVVFEYEPHPDEITLLWCTSEVLVSGCRDGKLRCFSTDAKAPFATFPLGRPDAGSEAPRTLLGALPSSATTVSLTSCGHHVDEKLFVAADASGQSHLMAIRHNRRVAPILATARPAPANHVAAGLSTAADMSTAEGAIRLNASRAELNFVTDQQVHSYLAPTRGEVLAVVSLAPYPAFVSCDSAGFISIFTGQYTDPMGAFCGSFEAFTPRSLLPGAAQSIVAAGVFVAATQELYTVDDQGAVTIWDMRAALSARHLLVDSRDAPRGGIKPIQKPEGAGVVPSVRHCFVVAPFVPLVSMEFVERRNLFVIGASDGRVFLVTPNGGALGILYPDKAYESAPPPGYYVASESAEAFDQRQHAQRAHTRAKVLWAKLRGKVLGQAANVMSAVKAAVRVVRANQPTLIGGALGVSAGSNLDDDDEDVDAAKDVQWRPPAHAPTRPNSPSAFGKAPSAVTRLPFERQRGEVRRARPRPRLAITQSRPTSAASRADGASDGDDAVGGDSELGPSLATPTQLLRRDRYDGDDDANATATDPEAFVGAVSAKLEGLRRAECDTIERRRMFERHLKPLDLNGPPFALTQAVSRRRLFQPNVVAGLMTPVASAMPPTCEPAAPGWVHGAVGAPTSSYPFRYDGAFVPDMAGPQGARDRVVEAERRLQQAEDESLTAADRKRSEAILKSIQRKQRQQQEDAARGRNDAATPPSAAADAADADDLASATESAIDAAFAAPAAHRNRLQQRLQASKQPVDPENESLLDDLRVLAEIEAAGDAVDLTDIQRRERDDREAAKDAAAVAATEKLLSGRITAAQPSARMAAAMRHQAAPQFERVPGNLSDLLLAAPTTATPAILPPPPSPCPAAGAEEREMVVEACGTRGDSSTRTHDAQPTAISSTPAAATVSRTAPAAAGSSLGDALRRSAPLYPLEPSPLLQAGLNVGKRTVGSQQLLAGRRPGGPAMFSARALSHVTLVHAEAATASAHRPGTPGNMTNNPEALRPQDPLRPVSALSMLDSARASVGGKADVLAPPSVPRPAGSAKTYGSRRKPPAMEAAAARRAAAANAGGGVEEVATPAARSGAHVGPRAASAAAGSVRVVRQQGGRSSNRADADVSLRAPSSRPSTAGAVDCMRRSLLPPGSAVVRINKQVISERVVAPVGSSSGAQGIPAMVAGGDDGADDGPLGRTSGFRFAHDTAASASATPPVPHARDDGADSSVHDVDATSSPRLGSREPPPCRISPRSLAEAGGEAPRPSVATAAMTQRPTSTASLRRRRNEASNTAVGDSARSLLSAQRGPLPTAGPALPVTDDPPSRTRGPATAVASRAGSASRGLRRGPVMKSALVAERQPALGVVAARPDLSDVVSALPEGSQMRAALGSSLGQRR